MICDFIFRYDNPITDTDFRQIISDLNDHIYEQALYGSWTTLLW